jgi:hypothetical protein
MSSSAAVPLRETMAPEPVRTHELASASPAWGPVKRFLLRFGFVYFLLLMMPFVVSVLPFGRPVVRPYEALWESVGTSVGRQVFGVEVQILEINGSGDTTYDYVRTFCHLVLAVLLGLLWTVLDRKRSRDPRLYEWFRVFLRLSLAMAMIVYGTVKLIPTQFGPIPLYRLLQPFGETSPMGLLWGFMAVSPAYTAFSGAAETLGGLLLIPRRTTLLGALVSAAVLTQVVMLNFCYDVPVKLFSSNLLVIALLIAAPDLRRLAGVFLFNRPVEPVEMHPLFASRRLNRIAAAVWAIGLAGYTVYSLYGAHQVNKESGFLAPKPPLYGVWEVEELIEDGVVRPPLLTDGERWRRWFFEEAGYVRIQRMKGSRPGFYEIEQDSAKKTFTLQEYRDPRKKHVLSYRRPKPEILVMDGKFEGRKVRARLRRMDSELLLTSRGFHWINERPFNR